MTTESSDQILVAQQGNVAVVTLNRPDVINAINMYIRGHLPEIMHQLDEDPLVGAIVIAGVGERGFCAGADIKEPRPEATPVSERKRLMPTSWIECLDRISKPVVAAVHGVCMGAGLELAMACDIRVVAAGARLALPETALGLIPGGGGTQRLGRLIGVGRALDMILTGEVVDARRALQIGLASRLAESPQGAQLEAMRIAALIAERAPLAIAYAKEAVLSGITLSLEAGLRLEKSLFAILTSTLDRSEAAAAFRDKRKPRFSGN